MTRSSRLWAVLGANLALVGVMAIVGASSHSLGVWAEGVDYLADAAAIGLALVALRWERRAAATGRASRWAAGVNAGWLLALSVAVAGGAVARLAGGARHVHGLPVLIISGVAAAVMALGAWILGGDTDGGESEDADLSLRAVLLDTAADAAAAAGVAASGLVIWTTGAWFWLDPAAALTISLVVAYHAARLLARIHSPRAA